MQDLELFSKEIKEQGLWGFFDLKPEQKAHHLLSSPSCFPITRQSNGTNTEERVYLDRNFWSLEYLERVHYAFPRKSYAPQKKPKPHPS